MKVFHFKEKIDSLPKSVSNIKAPVHVRIKPTNVCNHNCWYCAYRVGSLQLGKDMNKRDFIPEGKMMEIIDDLEAMSVKAVTFSGGGDPFCYPYLLEASRRLSQTWIKFAALTNGSRLRDELAEVFSFNATWLRISMDGWDDESYSCYRSVPVGEFSKVLRNMEDFNKLDGECHLGVSLIVGPANASHLYEFMRRLKDVGVDSVKVSACIVSNVGAENNEYHSSIFDEVREQIKRAEEKLKDSEYEIFDSYHESDEMFSKDYTWCPYLQILPVIGADLNVYSCHDKAYNVDCGMIGSIRGQSFNDLWFSDKDRFFSINPSVDCDHHCIANSKNKIILDYLGADQDHVGFV